jgi:hypothetical protein
MNKPTDSKGGGDEEGKHTHFFLGDLGAPMRVIFGLNSPYIDF